MDELNENQLIIEKEREDKEKNKWVEIGHPSTETHIEVIVQDMS